MIKLTHSFFATLLFIAFSTLNVYGQELITAEELTPEFLKKTFENAYIEVVEVEETYIAIKNFHKFYLDIDDEKRYIDINVNYKINDEAKAEEVLQLMNKLNKEVALIKAYMSDDMKVVTYRYYFWTKGGFTQKSLVETINLFKAALSLALNKDDKDIL